MVMMLKGICFVPFDIENIQEFGGAVHSSPKISLLIIGS